MNRKEVESVGLGQTKPEITTIAFVRSLVAWEGAVSASAALSQPCGLYSLVDLVDAATNLETARKWVEYLDNVGQANAEIVADGERRGAKEHDLANVRTLGDYVRSAHKHAEEHVKQLLQGALRR